MLDQCSIQVEAQIRVDPAVFTDKSFRIGNALLPAASCGFRRQSSQDQQHGKQQENEQADDDDDDDDDDEADDDVDIDEERRLEKRATGRIVIFEDNALVVYTRSIPQPIGRSTGDTVEDHVVDSILLNLPKILFGHNGQTLTNDAAICLGLTYVRCALSKILVRPEEAFLLIPGLSPRNTSRWRSLEVAMNIEDKNREIFRQMANMRSSTIRDNPVVREKNTVYQRGSKYTIKAYDKVAQLKAKKKPRLTLHSDSPTEITRLELQIKSQGLTLDKPNPTPSLATYAEFREKHKLVSFNYEFLKLQHRKRFSGLRAVYMPEPTSGKSSKEGYGLLLAALCLKRDIPVAEVIETFESCAKRKPGAAGELRRTIEEAISRSSSVDADTLLSDDNYLRQPAVAFTNSYPYSRCFPEIKKPDSEIVLAYAKGVPEAMLLEDLRSLLRSP